MKKARPDILVVFDCDGTLVDSQHNVVACMRLAFESLSMPIPEELAIRRTIGLNPEIAVRHLAGVALDDIQLENIVSGYKNAFFQRRLQPDHHEPLFAGVRETLSELAAQQISMAVATGKSLRGLNAVINQHGLHDYFISLQTPDNNPGKPHPQMLERAMMEAGTLPERTFMIGDTSFDMMLAKNAGCRGIGVTWGYHDADELLESGAERLIDRPEELLDIIRTS
ncbi:HAD-IA family hydrolase [uncultured Sneathiella sp.]|uniref:HAD-IA family hydrolase n=1 Tax=uncultured Sneathiella sp. TaxID=879315 RepID=UPI0030ECA59D|tara:strand:- start:15812 stop:16486 length:675 start_codon:yes stop_codon:yes gene_type:complete